MPISICHSCGAEYHWQWEEAFDKFGFNDGDGQIETDQVVDALSKAGYVVATETWGLHNTLIVSIEKDGRELMPVCDNNVRIGYDDARSYLPCEIVSLLDSSF